MLTVPAHIVRAGILDAPLTHAWNDADPMMAYAAWDDRISKALSSTTHRGVLALSAGFAEWIAWRLSKATDVTPLLDKIEAVWAGIADWRHLAMPGWFELIGGLGPPSDWLGPARGPVWAASDLLDQIVNLTHRRQFARPEAACLSKLATLVLAAPRPFKVWRKAAIARMAAVYPHVPDDALGPPVAREILELDRPYQREEAEELVARFLAGLDPGRNRFLANATVVAGSTSSS